MDSASGSFKRGFAYLAVDAKVPVIPLYLSGTDRVMPKGARFPLPGGISVGIGAPIPPGDDYETLVVATKAAMEELRFTVQQWEAA